MSAPSRFSILALAFLCAGGSAWAAPAPSVNWTDMKALDLEKVFRSDYASSQHLYAPTFPASYHTLALNDVDNRVSQEFHVHGPMRDVVGFWLKIYTQYSSRHLVIFDRNHPEVVYEVMDFQNLFLKSRNLMAYEITRENQVKATIRRYKAAFARLSAQKKPLRNLKPSNAIERNIVSALLRSGHSHGIPEWTRGLRAQTGQRDNIVKGLLAAETFFPKMEEIFRQLDVPVELTRLPLVESSFNLNAHSKAGALGVWQFMPASGKEFLRVDPQSGIDERRSPLKSTVAAARLLKRNLFIAGNWPLAITAYNHGYTGIKKLNARERATALTGHLFEICRKKKTLGYASQNYYAEFLALLHAEAYKDLFFGDSPLPVAPEVKFHKLQRPFTAKQLADIHGVPLKELRLFNPDILRVDVPLPRDFYVVLPGEASMVDELVDAIRLKTRARPKTLRAAARGSRRLRL